MSNLAREEKAWLNNYATRSLRDVADQDYIAARLCYRSGLMLQFVWMAQQAIEKYLKAILLYNGRSAKGLGHDLTAALKCVEAIERIEFTLSPESRKFLAYVDAHGENRYLEKPHHTFGINLSDLDKCVWDLRLYCHDIDFEWGRHGQRLKEELERIRKWQASDEPRKFGLFNGQLEKALKDPRDPRRAALVWQNLCYGARSRWEVKLPNRKRAINPAHMRHPEHFDLLDRYVTFPKYIREHFALLKAKGKSKGKP